MARATKPKTSKKKAGKKPTAQKTTRKKPNKRIQNASAESIGLRRRIWRWALRIAVGVAVISIIALLFYRIINPTMTPYMVSEKRRLGTVDMEWVPLSDIAPVMARSVVAAEDANFCEHWGFDMAAIRDALSEGAGRGASTISQQTVKNLYLWHGRSWTRKVLEAMITPAIEATWPKRRILEVYLNIAEFDEGVFGVEAASRHYFGVGPEALSATQAARLAAILPSPKKRSASRPSALVLRRARAIADGAATIANDGRAACFED